MIAHSDTPAWERLTSYPLSAHERTSLITSIFSDRTQLKVVRNLLGDDAQAFIDVVDEVIHHQISDLEGKPINFVVNLHIRCWTPWHQGSA